MATHDDHAEIEPLCLTTFIPNVDDELSRQIEDVLPAHHARRERCTTTRRWGQGQYDATGTRLYGMVDQACPVGVVATGT